MAGARPGRLAPRRVPGWGLALAVLAIALAIRAVDPGFVEDTRLHGFDAAQHLWPRPEAADPVQIVAIDEESLAARGQWPWPRSLVADLVRRIAAGRPVTEDLRAFAGDAEQADDIALLALRRNGPPGV